MRTQHHSLRDSELRGPKSGSDELASSTGNSSQPAQQSEISNSDQTFEQGIENEGTNEDVPLPSIIPAAPTILKRLHPHDDAMLYDYTPEEKARLFEARRKNIVYGYDLPMEERCLIYNRDGTIFDDYNKEWQRARQPKSPDPLEVEARDSESDSDEINSEDFEDMREQARKAKRASRRQRKRYRERMAESGISRPPIPDPDPVVVMTGGSR